MDLTLVQYASSAGMALDSASLKMPCLNTSFDSDAPMAPARLNIGYQYGMCRGGERARW